MSVASDASADPAGGKQCMTRLKIADLMALGGAPLRRHLASLGRQEVEDVTMELFGAWHGLVGDTAGSCRWWRLYAERAGDVAAASGALEEERLRAQTRRQG